MGVPIYFKMDTKKVRKIGSDTYQRKGWRWWTYTTVILSQSNTTI